MAHDNIRPLGVRSNPKGLCHRIHSKSSHQLGSKMHSCSSKFRGQKSSLSGNSKFIGEKCNCSGACRPSGSRFLQHLFLGPKENGGIPSNSKFKTTKQFRCAQGVQTGFHPHYKNASSARGLYNVPGFKGCLQSHPNKRISSEISPVRIYGKPLSIQGSSFRSIIKPSSFLQNIGLWQRTLKKLRTLKKIFKVR